MKLRHRTGAAYGPAADCAPARSSLGAAALAVVGASMILGILTGCGSGGANPTTTSSASGLTAGSGCKTYLTATKDAQDAAVKEIAVAQNENTVLTPLGRPKVDYFCINDDGLTLGGAIAHAGGKPLIAAKGRNTPTSRHASARTSSPSSSPSVVTRTIALPQPPSGPVTLREAFNSAVAVDPNPYMGAHPNVYFMSPSQNIGCYVFIDLGNSVECTIAMYNFSQPGADCPGGAVVSIQAGGTPSIPTCATTSLLRDSSKTLQYGQSVTNGNLACVSASVGVSCLDLTTGAGFTLSRDQYIPVG